MSREPQSAANRYGQAQARSGEPTPYLDRPAPPPSKPKARKGARVRVEPATKKPQRERAYTKAKNTTQRLTAEERDLLREYREIHQIEAAWRARRGKR